MRWLVLVVAACASPHSRPAAAPTRLDPGEIEAATGTAGPFLHAVAGRAAAPAGIPLTAAPDARVAPPEAGAAAPDAGTVDAEPAPDR